MVSTTPQLALKTCQTNAVHCRSLPSEEQAVGQIMAQTPSPLQNISLYNCSNMVATRAQGGNAGAHLKENMLSAMGNVDTGRLLDRRFLDLEGWTRTPELFPIVTEL